LACWVGASGVTGARSLDCRGAGVSRAGFSAAGFSGAGFSETAGAGAAGTNSVRRLNPYTNIISTYRVPTLGGNPAGVHANADGTVWVSEYYANAFALLFPTLAPHTTEMVSPNARNASNNALANVVYPFFITEGS